MLARGHVKKRYNGFSGIPDFRYPFQNMANSVFLAGCDIDNHISQSEGFDHAGHIGLGPNGITVWGVPENDFSSSGCSISDLNAVFHEAFIRETGAGNPLELRKRPWVLPEEIFRCEVRLNKGLSVASKSSGMVDFSANPA
jgi:hypothetical protein